MTGSSDLSKRPEQASERLPDEGRLIDIGQWYWTADDEDGKKTETFACVTKVGSNFVEFTTPFGQYYRIHLSQFEKLCRPEPNPEAVVKGKTDHYQTVVREKIREINALTRRLGVNDTQNLECRPEEEASRSLSVLSGTDNVKAYEKSLIQAKDKDLPKLFEEVKEASESLTLWMKAQTLPMQGLVDNMSGCIETIEDRIFNVSLYAGLTEEVITIKEGKPAAITEKLRIMQRLAYMDEECLVNYQHGGMEFKNIKAFDKWLAKPENLDRLLPFPRCMTAFRVRRVKKDRGPALDLSTAYINFQFEKLDALTFLYIKNGGFLYRMNCDLEFGELIYPSRDEFTLDEPMMASMSSDNVKEVITRRHYDDLLQKHKEHSESEKIKSDAWDKANPKERSHFNPHYNWNESFSSRSFYKYEPFTQNSVYYDEIKGEIERRIKHYNRIALIVQGLYDRSPVLHPHPPIQLWSPGGFEQAVELIYADHALHHGAAPDFAAYKKLLGESIGHGSVVIGQQDFWTALETKRQNERWNRVGQAYASYTPYGNPGPGFVAKIDAWSKRTRKATFKWTRERRTHDYWSNKKYGDPINTSVTVPADLLFNVSAYKPGDFKQFYADPRTRAQYLGWADLLLSAEEYHAGNIKIKSADTK